MIAAEEARDQLRPLPIALVHNRTTTSASVGRSERTSVASFVAAALVGRRSHAMRSLGGTKRQSLLRSTSPLRSMGSLTAWQALAAEVQQAMRLGAAAAGVRWGPGSSSSELAGISIGSQGRSSQIEPHLIMSEESSALVPDVDSSQRLSSGLLLLAGAATLSRRQRGSIAGLKCSGADGSHAPLAEDCSSVSGDRSST